MNEDARDSSTPTGQALGSIALLGASVLAVGAGGYLGTKAVGKVAKAGDSVLAKVTNREAKDAKRMLDDIDPYAEKGVNKARAKEFTTNRKQEQALEKIKNKDGNQEVYNDLKNQYGIKRDGPSKWDEKIKQQEAASTATSKRGKPPTDDVTEAMFDEADMSKAYR